MLFYGTATVALAQSDQAASQNTDVTTPDIALNFPDEVELKVLIDLVSKRLSLNILYDEQVARKKVTIRSPAKVPEKSLLALLESALRMKGL